MSLAIYAFGRNALHDHQRGRHEGTMTVGLSYPGAIRLVDGAVPGQPDQRWPSAQGQNAQGAKSIGGRVPARSVWLAKIPKPQWEATWAE